MNHNRPPVSIQRRKTKYWLTWIFKPGRFLRHVTPSGVPLIRLGELAFSAALVLFPGLMLVMDTLGLRMKEFKQIVLDIQDLVLTSLVYLSSLFFFNSSNYWVCLLTSLAIKSRKRRWNIFTILWRLPISYNSLRLLMVVGTGVSTMNITYALCDNTNPSFWKFLCQSLTCACITYEPELSCLSQTLGFDCFKKHFSFLYCTVFFYQWYFTILWSGDSFL